MPTVLLVGAFGQGNPGDEAHLTSFLAALDGWRVVATSSDPDATKRTHDCDVVSSRDIREVAAEVARADALVFGGGTIFKTLHPASGRPPNDLLGKGLALAAGARVLGKRVAMVGVGAGRLDGNYARLLARRFAYRTDLLVLRDEESATILRRAGVRPPFRIGADPAWALLTESAQQHDRREGVVVTLSQYAGDSSLAVLLTATLRPLVDEGIPVVLQPWQPSGGSGGDELLAHEIRDALGVPVLPPPIDIRRARDELASFRLVIGLRFHSLMAAAAAGTPFVAFGHEAKLLALARTLGQPHVLAGVGPQTFTRTIRRALAAPPPPPAAIREQISAAHAGFHLMQLLLDGPDALPPEDVQGLELTPVPRAP